MPNHTTKWFIAIFVLLLLQQSLFDVLFIPGAFGHGAYWLIAALSAKIASSLVLASLLYVFRKKWFPLLVYSILTFWMLANGVYYHATGLYITYDVLTMANGLHGFTSSILFYLGWRLVPVALLFLLLLWTVMRFKLNFSWRKTGIIWGIAVMFSLVGGVSHYGYQCELCKHAGIPSPRLTWDFFRVFDLYGDARPSAWRDGEHWYIERHSISMAFPHLFVHALHQHREDEQSQLIPFTQEESDFLSSIHTESSQPISGHLVVVLVESLESWALSYRDMVGNPVMPNLQAWEQKHPCLMASDLICQKRYGESGDGQLIVVSGLLPTQEGVACMKYAHHTFPSFAHLFADSYLINPAKNVWNQTIMAQRYGFKHLIEPASSLIRDYWKDEQVFQKLRLACEQADTSSCFLALTMSSHSPFNRVQYKPLSLSDDLTQMQKDYLQCIHYADSCMGTFLNWADTVTCMQGATIVITSDHTIFNDTYCPLLITSPAITQDKYISVPYYQMDIYPTILAAINQQAYSWHGFGINLLDSLADETIAPNRIITPQDASILSDKLIRKDWFRDSTIPKDSTSHPIYIAHAGGAIDGFLYTNSMEAVQNALSHGINHIELDLGLTADNHLVCIHDWPSFHNITGYEGDSIPLTLEEFKNRKILDRYTPITHDDIDSLMTNHLELHLVTDKISTPEVINKYLRSYRDRVLVECFSLKDYFILEKDGYYTMYSKRPHNKRFGPVFDLIQHFGPCGEMVATRYTFRLLGTTQYKSSLPDYKSGYGDTFAVFSMPNRDKADSLAYLDSRIKYIYIDSVE